MSIESHLADRFGDEFEQQVPLSNYTTLKIGGPAQFLVVAKTSEEIVDAYKLCLENDCRFYLLGGGSNLLISDTGLSGLVVINQTESIDWHDDKTVTVSGGYELDQFVGDCSKQGWGDMTFAAGIPGSLGGALAGGAGAFGHLVSEYFIQAKVLLMDGHVVECGVKELGVQYRSSDLKKRGDIILDVTMGTFTSTDPCGLLNEVQRIKSERETKHPGSSLPSAGSFFKNLPTQEPGGHRIPAGKYLDEAGVKEMRVGDAAVFEKHANIIVNHGHATAKQVDELAKQMAQRVEEQFGIKLEREVQFLT